MSASFGQSTENSQDIELNLASIIDCFTVLIAFMLASATFLAIGIMDAGLSGGGADAAGADPPDVEITARLKNNKTFIFELQGKASDRVTYSTVEELRKRIGEVKVKFPKVNTVTILPDDEVEYDRVVQSMAEIHKEMPNVLLGAEQ